MHPCSIPGSSLSKRSPIEGRRILVSPCRSLPVCSEPTRPRVSLETGYFFSRRFWSRCWVAIRCFSSVVVPCYWYNITIVKQQGWSMRLILSLVSASVGNAWNERAHYEGPIHGRFSQVNNFLGVKQGEYRHRRQGSTATRLCLHFLFGSRSRSGSTAALSRV